MTHGYSQSGTSITGRHDLPAIERLMIQVVVNPESKCWVWQGGTTKPPPRGYGRLRVDGEKVVAHRFSFESFVRPIPQGLTVDHWCRNRLCVNPFHLRPVTMPENNLIGASFAAANAALITCKKGHQFNFEFFTVRGKRNFRRFCYVCRKRQQAAYRQGATR